MIATLFPVSLSHNTFHDGACSARVVKEPSTVTMRHHKRHITAVWKFTKMQPAGNFTYKRVVLDHEKKIPTKLF
jgi:hypothetical protein